MAPVIDGSSFGTMTVGGEVCRGDVIVFPDRVRRNWRRRQGHSLDITDLDEALAWSPEVLVIGTGVFGVMKVPESLVDALGQRGLEVAVARTGEAVRIFNEHLGRGSKVVGAFHLTC